MTFSEKDDLLMKAMQCLPKGIYIPQPWGALIPILDEEGSVKLFLDELSLVEELGAKQVEKLWNALKEHFEKS